MYAQRTIREYMFPEEYPITAKRYPVIPPFMMSVHIGEYFDLDGICSDRLTSS